MSCTQMHPRKSFWFLMKKLFKLSSTMTLFDILSYVTIKMQLWRFWENAYLMLCWDKLKVKWSMARAVSSNKTKMSANMAEDLEIQVHHLNWDKKTRSLLPSWVCAAEFEQFNRNNGKTPREILQKNQPLHDVPFLNTITLDQMMLTGEAIELTSAYLSSIKHRSIMIFLNLEAPCITNCHLCMEKRR